MDGTAPPVASRVRQAIDEADVGREALDVDASLVDLAGVEVFADGCAVSVTVTLPVPDDELRARLERDLRSAGTIDGVSSIEITWQSDPPDAGRRVDVLPGVKNVIAVASGKGGVGKSTIAANLATSLAATGVAVGFLDADVYGPNAPALLGLSDGTPATTREDRIVPREAHGVRVMSMDFVVGEEDPVIWRGPMVDDVLGQLLGDVDWGELDYLVVDLPPGTGDAQLTLVQHLPVTGAVIVTTPQAVAVDDARLGLEGFTRYDVPILGIVENMSGFRCPDCDSVHHVFGEGGGAALAEEYSVPLLGRIPLDPAVHGGDGQPGPGGITIPLIGRVGLPRTGEERDGRRPPVSIREAGGESRTALRKIATRVAARAALFASRST